MNVLLPFGTKQECPKCGTYSTDCGVKIHYCERGGLFCPIVGRPEGAIIGPHLDYVCKCGFALSRTECKDATGLVDSISMRPDSYISFGSERTSQS